MNVSTHSRREFLHRSGVVSGLALLDMVGTPAMSHGADDDSPFAGLEPRALWEHFAKFTQTPRESGNEAAIADHILAWAASQGFESLKDAAGNVVVRVPATPGRELAPVVIIQGHMDMVCSRDDAAGPFDPKKGKIRVIRVEKRGDAFVEAKDGKFLTADKTTLGADCGVACSGMMAIAADRAKPHGRLELLFTVDEESGLRGANLLDTTQLSGKICLNVDSEEDGILTIGSCGGRNTVITFSRPRTSIADGEIAIKLSITGLLGGHSGVDINKGRLNAIKALGQVLQESARQVPIRLGFVNGGDASNAIPGEADAIVFIPSSDEASYRKVVDGAWTSLRAQYLKLETRMDLRVAREERSHRDAMASSDSRQFIDLLRAIPSGVIAMSQKVEALVESSNNLGVVRTDDRAIKITCSSRSSVETALEQTTDSLRSIARLAGADAVPSPAYPGWDSNPESAVVNAVSRTYRRLHGVSPKLQAIHAGLECGVIASKIPGLDTVSFGPTIEGAHSNQERVKIATVAKFYDLLSAVLADLSAN